MTLTQNKKDQSSRLILPSSKCNALTKLIISFCGKKKKNKIYMQSAINNHNYHNHNIRLSLVCLPAVLY